MINEKLGIAEASTYYADIITMRSFSLLEDFESKNPTPDESDRKYEIRFTYRDLKGFITNWEKYKKFPVSEINFFLKIKCSSTLFGKEDISISALAYPYSDDEDLKTSRFKKPIKKSTEHSLSLAMDMEIEYKKSVFEKGKIYVSNYIKAAVLHELNHFYEDYRRKIKGSPPLKYAIAASIGDNIRKVQGDLYRVWYNSFTILVYKAEPHETNACIQEGLPQIKEMGLEEFKTTRLWKEAIQMEIFNADNFMEKFNEIAVRHNKEYDKVLLEKLKNDFLDDYEKYCKDFEETPRYNIEHLKSLSIEKFFKFWQKIINKAGERIIKGYKRLVSYEESIEIKKFGNFINENAEAYKYHEFPKNMHQLNLACLKCKLLGYDINDDLSISIYSDVDISNRGFENIPIFFHIVKGDFNCSNNNLKSMDGAPLITDSFNCSNNIINSLYGSPETINGNFDISNNKINSISGGPVSIKGYFNFSNNNVMYIGEFPKVNGEIIYTGNPIEEIINLFPEKDRKEAFSEMKNYGPIWNDKNIWVVSEMFLEEMFEDICGKKIEIPTSFKNYKIIT